MTNNIKPDKGRFYRMALALFLAALILSQILNVLWDVLVKGAM